MVHIDVRHRRLADVVMDRTSILESIAHKNVVVRSETRRKKWIRRGPPLATVQYSRIASSPTTVQQNDEHGSRDHGLERVPGITFNGIAALRDGRADVHLAGSVVVRC